MDGGIGRNRTDTRLFKGQVLYLLGYDPMMVLERGLKPLFPASQTSVLFSWTTRV